MRSPLQLDQDSIVALATPPGMSAVAILRLSGVIVLPLIIPFLRFPSGGTVGSDFFTPRMLHRLNFIDPDHNAILDHVLIVYFPAPFSFTGEDVVEIQGHGSPVVLSRMLEIFASVGIRAAAPGEFSRRAYLNGKMDLVQAESLMRLIEASSLRAAREATRHMEGDLSERLKGMRHELLTILSHLEASLDFSEDEIDPLGTQVLKGSLMGVVERLEHLLAHSLAGQHLRDGFDLVLVGRPNVGKSSLFNRLAGKDRAIVTSIPGTTRDLNEFRLMIDGVAINLVDTAGLRRDGCEIEREGIRRALARMQEADGVLFVAEAHTGMMPEEEALLSEWSGPKTLLVWNKADLLPPSPTLHSNRPSWLSEKFVEIFVSCRDGSGLEDLLGAIGQFFTHIPADGEGTLLLVARHRQALMRVQALIKECIQLIIDEMPEEIIVIPLREGLAVLGDITGEVSQEDLLDLIFNTFCIGK
ncbi:MAG: tRNA uridine-5-carboxymethylaminomethyl(34) synthesis GTPase MnmE [Magnetococcus sp. DMHC-6]